ncbi:ATP-binding protein [Actinomadura rudentiformis]|uniref:ATP-binding protein n=1 Tax=Actinomadura rudentiformis TaxID=359158 RepID=A0A6H9YKC6_9ACTN|nr:ATP-binding protein [Actinomadura rudentiformis]KAB2339610.1 ATP-binding protein [Actinomadura rudentiformis]
MIVDQADVETFPADGARRPWRPPALDHELWPDTHQSADQTPGAVPAVTVAVVPGLAGRWPTPPAGDPRTARRVLRADATSSKTARDFTLATLAEWDLTHAAEDIVIAVSELVTNALRHGLRDLPQPAPTHPIQLVLLGHPRRLVVAVTDPGPGTPVPVEQIPERFGEGGRGLLVVGAISGAWGWAPLTTGGKAVWAAFDLRPAQAA